MNPESFATVIVKMEKVIRPLGFKIKKAEEKRDNLVDSSAPVRLLVSLFYEDVSDNQTLVTALDILVNHGFKIAKVERDTDPSFGGLYVKNDFEPGFIVITVYEGELG
jgi:hypothetical protein